MSVVDEVENLFRGPLVLTSELVEAFPNVLLRLSTGQVSPDQPTSCVECRLGQTLWLLSLHDARVSFLVFRKHEG